MRQSGCGRPFGCEVGDILRALAKVIRPTWTELMEMDIASVEAIVPGLPRLDAGPEQLANALGAVFGRR